jgi:hypothetical protein
MDIKFIILGFIPIDFNFDFELIGYLLHWFYNV